jgi:hypothetical protein
MNLLATLGRLEKRTLTRLGIEWQGLIYNSPDLTPMRIRENGKEVTFKFNPSDISAIFVFDKTLNNYIRVPALNQKITKGVSLWEHRVVLRNAKEDSKKVDSAALALAKKKIQDIISKRFFKATTTSRKKVSRFNNERFAPPITDQTGNTAGLSIDEVMGSYPNSTTVQNPSSVEEYPGGLSEPEEFANLQEIIGDDVEDSLEVFEADYDLT